MGEPYKVLGIYSKNIIDHTGAGTTMQKAEHKTYYYVLRSCSEKYCVEPLNAKSLPSGIFTAMDRDQFISSFTPEIGYYRKNSIPEYESLAKMLASGDAQSIDAADSEIESLIRSLLIEPDNTSPETDTPLAKARLSEIVAILDSSDKEFIEEQRREFNSAAISLRKLQLYEEAINFYSKALELDENDENLHFNIARAYFETGDEASTLAHIEKALEIDPVLESAILFKKYILKKGAKKTD
ncbi:tetratricopeptide repeat protein [Maridesulfovibrio sp.]|uniref:tetratricopeptide repeat protein n=1 Tax=Maridesulfovibrio sp. TaxID=2795000 RepID=UPI002A187BBE|nr:tetratricopeptide repeat protein [Maridesulfovibrio sp.]